MALTTTRWSIRSLALPRSDWTWTDADGAYLFADLDTADYVMRPEKVGDLDRGSTTLDASFALRYEVGLLELDGYQRLAGDVSGDSTVSSYDASLILRHVVSLVDGFPVGRALAVAEALSAYPQTALRNDRRAVFGGLSLPLAEGLELEARTHRDTTSDPKMWEWLRRYAAGDRPPPLRPPS